MNKLFALGTHRVLLFIFLATIFQLQELDAQSLSYSEGLSVWLANRPAAELLHQGAAGVDGPLYYFLLRGWIFLTGDSEWTLRFLSSLCAILAVPLIWQLARRLGGYRVIADVAALMTALSPLWLWYGREVEMYAFATVLLLVAAHFLLSLLSGGRHHHLRSAAKFALVATVALYTYPVLWLFMLAWLPAVLWRYRNQGQAALLPAGIAFGIPFLLSLPVMGAWFNGSSANPDAVYRPGVLFEHALMFWMTGHSVGPSQATLAGWSGGLLVIAGILAVAWRLMHRQPSIWPSERPPTSWPLAHHWLLLVGWLFLPPLFLGLLSARSLPVTPEWLMFGGPSFLILVGSLVGWFWMRRWAGRVVAVAMLCLFLGLFLSADRNLLTDPAFSKTDWRGVASYLEENRRPGEPVLLITGDRSRIFHHYYPSRENVLHLSRSSGRDRIVLLETETRAKLAETVRGADNVWLVSRRDELADADGLVPRLLQAAGGVSYSVPRYMNITLSRWRLPASGGFDFALKPQQSLDWQVDDGLRLVGWSMPSRALPADEGLFLVLYWSAQRPLQADYRVRLQVVDEAGFTYGQLDRHLTSDEHPTSMWEKDVPYVSVVSIPLEPGTPPGRYQVELTVFEQGSKRRVALQRSEGTAQRQTALIGPLQVAPPAIGWLGVGAPHDAQPIEALLLEQQLLGARLALPAQLEAGQQLPVTLWWRTGRALPGATLHLGWVQNGRLIEHRSSSRGGADWPGQRWRAGDLLMTPHLVEVPGTLQPGPAQLVCWLSGADGRMSKRVVLARGTVATAGNFTVPRDDGAGE